MVVWDPKSCLAQENCILVMVALPYLHGLGALHPDAFLKCLCFCMCCIVTCFESAFRKILIKSSVRIKESKNCLSLQPCDPLALSEKMMQALACDVRKIKKHILGFAVLAEPVKDVRG